MHLRSAAGVGAHTNCALAQHQCNEKVPLVMANAQANNATKGAAVTKKLLLWLLLLLQVFFIGCFWLLQTDFNASGSGSAGGTSEGPYAARGDLPTRSTTQDGVAGLKTAATAARVNFIKQAAAAGIEVKQHKKQQLLKAKLFKEQQADILSNFAKDFYLKPKLRLNKTLEFSITGYEEQLEPLEYELSTLMPALWCFREGTVNESSATRRRSAAAAEDYQLLGAGYVDRCECQPGWHGRDCGQPEIMWRAMIAAKSTLLQLQPSDGAAHRLLCMLEVDFVSLDMLELQVQTVAQVVDMFLIYVRNVAAKASELRTLKRRLGELLHSGNYYIFHCSQLRRQQNCTTAQAYAWFRKELKRANALQLQPTDLLLYSNDCALVSQLALKYLKYYAKDMPLMRLRLKHTVYGFYWQHPEQTHLTGVIGSLQQFDDPQLGRADPAQLLGAAQAPHREVLVIGDLNHFGGWYCEYCQQPEEIIGAMLLHAATYSSSSAQQVRFPNETRSRHIDVAYVEKLIANGLYVNGITQLLRAHADKYYAPRYAQENSWKFGHLLVNLYESLDDGFDDEGALY